MADFRRISRRLIVSVVVMMCLLTREFFSLFTPNILDEERTTSYEPLTRKSMGKVQRRLESSMKQPSLDFPWISHPEVPRGITLAEYKEYLQLLQDFVSIMYDANVTVSMYFGTLLGSYVAHNMLPWDDDVDFIMRQGDVCKAVRAIQKVHEEGIYSTVTKYFNPQIPNRRSFENVTCSDLLSDWAFHNLKFFAINASIKKPSNTKWNWPYLDVFVYMENETHVWPLTGKNGSFPESAVNKDYFYPLSLRPFGTLWLPAPRDTRYALSTTYSFDFEKECPTNYWIHRQEKNNKANRVKINYETVREYYPLVNRDRHNNGTQERLEFRGKVINEFLMRETHQ